MRVRTVSEVGAFIREHRTKAGLDQATLAKKAGTSRKWLIEVEHGKASAEIGLILRTLKALGVEIEFRTEKQKSTLRHRGTEDTNINDILSALKKRP